MSVQGKFKGKGKQPVRPIKKDEPIYVGSSGSNNGNDVDEDEDEDDFEEVPLPSTPAGGGGGLTSGASTPFPGTATPGSRGTALTAGTTPGGYTGESGDEGGYGDYDASTDSEKDEGVIRVEIGGETAEEKAKRIALALRKKPMTSKDRALRLETHKIHLIALIANARIRNTWANDTLLKCRLLSLLPHPLVTAFSIPPSRFPDRAQRSRLFFDALQALVTWWSQAFFDIPEPNVGVRTRPWDEVQEVIDKLPRLTRADLMPQPLFVERKAGSSSKPPSAKDKEKEMDAKLAQYSPGANEEKLRSINSLMKRAVLQNGSRDVSAILFVSLCRACGLGTRLAVNLQAVPWRAEKVVVKKMSGETKGGRTVASRQGNGGNDDDDDDSMEEVPIPDPAAESGGPGAVMDKIKHRRDKNGIRQAGRRRHQDPADVYRLKKPKAAPQTTGGTPKKPKTKLDMANQSPVMWAEVFSRSDQRWIPVDPVRGTIRRKTHFEPTSDNGPVRMAYVLALEEDGYGREVTLRYTKSFGAKTSKLRVPTRKDEPDWWEGVLGLLARPYRLNRDDLEDAELETSQVSEAMPMHLSGFKDHPIYVLERHLKREEVIQPKREVGKFRGEPVYRRANVHSCKTSENWMRVGRRVKARQDPMKWVKQRAMTLNRRREVEMARQNGEEQMQGLYAEWQTEVYRPPPIRDEIIPQNAFGNIDLYAPTMLPAGAAHLPYKGIAKVAKQLGISYAEACTGFEFKKQRAIPVITGIVVPEGQVETVMAAYKESAAAAEEREKRKREEKALTRWAKLINGLRVRERLREAYGDKEGLHEQSHNPLADPSERPQRKMNATSILAGAQKEASEKWVEKMRSTSRSVSPIKEEVEEDRHAAEPINVKVEDEEGEDDDMEEVPLQTVSEGAIAPPTVQTPGPAEEEGSADETDEDEEDDEEEMEEVVDVVRPSISIVPPSRPSRTRQAPPQRNAPATTNRSSLRRDGSATSSTVVQNEAPERVQPRRTARSTKKIVDNPYEESSEDDEKAYLEVEEDEDDGKSQQVDPVKSAVIEETTKMDAVADDSQGLPAPNQEKEEGVSGGIVAQTPIRKLRLRLGANGSGEITSSTPSNDKDGAETGRRTTRSSAAKRKR